MAEYWDIFDMDRRSTGRQHLRGTPMADGDYHLVVNIWVVNSAGQVLLTQRHPDIPFGLKWACTGGSAITGEDTLTAALRETREEIGLEVGTGAPSAQLSGHLCGVHGCQGQPDCDAAGGGRRFLLGG